MIELTLYEDKLTYIYRKRSRSIQPSLFVYKQKLWIKKPAIGIDTISLLRPDMVIYSFQYIVLLSITRC